MTADHETSLLLTREAELSFLSAPGSRFSGRATRDDEVARYRAVMQFKRVVAVAMRDAWVGVQVCRLARSLKPSQASVRAKLRSSRPTSAAAASIRSIASIINCASRAFRNISTRRVACPQPRSHSASRMFFGRATLAGSVGTTNLAFL